MISLKAPLDLLNRLLELLVKLLETLVNIVETLRKSIEEKVTAKTINQLSLFVVYALVILISQTVAIILVSTVGK